MPLVVLLALLQQPRIEPKSQAPVPWVVVERLAPERYDTVFKHQLVRLEDGAYVASFEHEGHYGSRLGTFVCRSRDGGRTWSTVAKLAMPRYTSLFSKGTVLYLLGVDGNGRGTRGNVLISRSTDQGETWTTVSLRDDRYQATHGPTIEHGGRFWRPFIRSDYSGGNIQNHAIVASASVDSDLLSADAWRWSEELELPSQIKFGWHRSSMISDGGPTPVLVVYSKGPIQAVADPSSDGSKLTLRSDPLAWTASDDALGSRLIRDPKSGSFLALRGWRFEPVESGDWWEGIELASSPDLLDWQEKSRLIRAPGSNDPHFKACDWLIEDEDLLVIQTVSFPEEPGQTVIFYRVPKFRERKLDDPPLWGPALPK